MKVTLQTESPANRPFLKFLYESLREGFETTEDEFKGRYSQTNIAGRQHLSTIVEWGGKTLFFDLSDHAFLWNLDALEQCDVYFKANLHWGIVKKFLGDEMLQKHRSKIAPFLLFAPDLRHLNKRRFVYQLLGKFRPYDVCQIVGVYKNHIQLSKNGVSIRGIPKDCSPDQFHFWIRYLTHVYLESSSVSSFSRLTSKGQKDNEDGLVIYPSINKHHFFQKIAASKYEFVNIMPHALLPWKATEGLVFDTPLIHDHNPLMEMPKGFELKEDVHYLSLLGDRFDFDLSASVNDPKCYRLLNAISEADLGRAFGELFDKMRDDSVYQGIKSNVVAFRKNNLTCENLCSTIEYYVENCS